MDSTNDYYKVIIAGSRSLENKLREKQNEIRELILRKISTLNTEGKPVEIVDGLAKGPDQFGGWIAKTRGLSHKTFPAKWGDVEGVKYTKKTRNGDLYNPLAGLIRNKEMGDYSDALILLWDGHSTGSEHMLKYMKSLNKPHIVLTEFKDF